MIDLVEAVLTVSLGCCFWAAYCNVRTWQEKDKILYACHVRNMHLIDARRYDELIDYMNDDLPYSRHMLLKFFLIDPLPFYPEEMQREFSKWQ